VSAVTAVCSECGFAQQTRSRRFSRQDESDERIAHLAVEHAGEGTYAVRERWWWLWWLAGANVVMLVISAVSLPLEDLLLGIVFPQIAGWLLFPPVGVIEIVVIALAAILYAVRAPAGASFGRRLFAGVTMSAFIAWAVVLVLTVLVLAGLSTALTS
jgi:hypothetical protein